MNRDNTGGDQLNKLSRLISNSKYASQFYLITNIIALYSVTFLCLRFLELFFSIKLFYIELLSKLNTSMYVCVGMLLFILGRLRNDVGADINEGKGVSEEERGINYTNTLSLVYVGILVGCLGIDGYMYNLYEMVPVMPITFIILIMVIINVFLSLYLYATRGFSDEKDSKKFFISVIAVVITILALFR